MKRTLTLVLCLSMMLSMLASCGSDSSDTADSSTTTVTSNTNSESSKASEGENVILLDEVAVSNAGEPEGVVAGTTANIYSVNDFVSQLLPGSFSGAMSFYSLVYDTLFWSPSGDWNDLEGLLVSDYSLDVDGLTFVMNLYEDVYFHNGNNLNAESVVGTFDFLLENAFVRLTYINSYEATGEYQITLYLNYVNPEMINDFASASLAIFDHNCYLEYGLTPEAAIGAGSGPYYIDSYAIGDNVVLKAEEDYWMEERQAHIETVTVKIITNMNTAYAALASGEIDYSAISDYSYYELLVGSEDHTIIAASGAPFTIWFNTGATGSCELLANENVRKALTLLIDHEQVAVAATGGYGTLGGNPLNAAFDEYYYNVPECNPEAGLALLEAEGINPEDIVLTGVIGTGADASLANIQAQLMEYGITFNYNATDMNVVMTNMITGDWDICISNGGLGSMPFYIVSQSLICGTDALTPVCTDPTIAAEVATLISQANICLTLEDTYEYFVEYCRVLDESYSYMMNYSGQSWHVFGNRIENYSIDQNIGAWRVYDSWIAE